MTVIHEEEENTLFFVERLARRTRVPFRAARLTGGPRTL